MALSDFREHLPNQVNPLLLINPHTRSFLDRRVHRSFSEEGLNAMAQ